MNTFYRKEIDFLRAIAVIFVILFHYFPKILPKGYLGVDLFFVISGFLIWEYKVNILIWSIPKIASFTMPVQENIPTSFQAILLKLVLELQKEKEIEFNILRVFV